MNTFKQRINETIKRFMANELLDDSKPLTKEDLNDMQGHLRLLRSELELC